MSEALWLFIAGILCLLGMSWVSAAMRVHWRQLHPSESGEPNQKVLRSLGGGAFFLAGICCLKADHASMAVLVWAMFLTGSAFIVAMMYTKNPGLLRLICPKNFNQSKSS